MPNENSAPPDSGARERPLELGSSRRATLLHRVRATLVDGTEPDHRTAAITAL